MKKILENALGFILGTIFLILSIVWSALPIAIAILIVLKVLSVI